MDEIKEEHSDRGANDDAKVGELMSVSQIEDDSDLIYEKEMKILLADHKIITRFLMGFGIFVMIAQLAFAVWCLIAIYGQVKETSEALLVIWYHILKILLNLYTIKDFMTTMKAKQTSSPMIRLASYITLLMYYGFLFVHKDKLSPNLDIEQLYLLGVYPASDWFCFFLSWILLCNIMKRRDQLLQWDSATLAREKKEDDLFDVKYLPEEYMSDEQETDED